AEFKGLTDEALVLKIKEIKGEREKLQAEIRELTKQRDAFVAKAKREAMTKDNTLGDRITKSVRKRLVEKDYKVKQ
ncbi:MAG: hypothetical protein AAF840_18855, partial [Bacteroidota bacterium]